MVNRELKIAYTLAIALLAVGVVCYAVPVKVPDQPLRKVFQSVAGRVFFDHNIHQADSGYGIGCRDCHHHPGGKTDTRSCGACHQPPKAEAVAPRACFDCHEADVLAETKMTPRGDAFHGQCIRCHKENEAGTIECAGCHML